jgi:hypothetical protein
MSSFPTQPTLTMIGKRVYKMYLPFVYLDSEIGQVTVPAGFVTDLNSVYRLPVIYLVFGEYGQEAAIIHDYLYATAEVTRQQADDVFYRALRDSGVARWRAACMYAAVRMFGSHYYDRDR